MDADKIDFGPKCQSDDGLVGRRVSSSEQSNIDKVLINEYYLLWVLNEAAEWI